MGSKGHSTDSTGMLGSESVPGKKRPFVLCYTCNQVNYARVYMRAAFCWCGEEQRVLGGTIGVARAVAFAYSLMLRRCL